MRPDFFQVLLSSLFRPSIIKFFEMKVLRSSLYILQYFPSVFQISKYCLIPYVTGVSNDITQTFYSLLLLLFQNILAHLFCLQFLHGILILPINYYCSRGNDLMLVCCFYKYLLYECLDNDQKMSYFYQNTGFPISHIANGR